MTIHPNSSVFYDPNATYIAYTLAVDEMRHRRPKRPTYASLTSETPDEYVEKMLKLRAEAENAFYERTTNYLKAIGYSSEKNKLDAECHLRFMSALRNATHAIRHWLNEQYPVLEVSDYAAWNVLTYNHASGDRYAAYDLPNKKVGELYEAIINGTYPAFSVPKLPKLQTQQSYAVSPRYNLKAFYLDIFTSMRKFAFG